MLPDGQPREFAGANGLTLQATPKPGELFLNLNLEHKFKSDITIRPTDGGHRLVVTRKTYFAFNGKPIESTFFYTKISSEFRFPSPAQESTASANTNSSIRLTITAELQQTIDSRYIDQALPVLLLVREPQRWAGATITCLITKRSDSAILQQSTGSGKTSELVFQIEGFRLPDGRSQKLLGAVDWIVSDHTTLRLQRTEVFFNSEARTGATSFPEIVSSYLFGRETVIPKGSAFGIEVIVPNQ
jgi:hypothetical protein